MHVKHIIIIVIMRNRKNTSAVNRYRTYNRRRLFCLRTLLSLLFPYGSDDNDRVRIRRSRSFVWTCTFDRSNRFVCRKLTIVSTMTIRHDNNIILYERNLTFSKICLTDYLTGQTKNNFSRPICNSTIELLQKKKNFFTCCKLYNIFHLII